MTAFSPAVTGRAYLTGERASQIDVLSGKMDQMMRDATVSPVSDHILQPSTHTDMQDSIRFQLITEEIVCCNVPKQPASYVHSSRH